MRPGLVKTSTDAIHEDYLETLALAKQTKQMGAGYVTSAVLASHAAARPA